jgi:hypothetical protein
MKGGITHGNRNQKIKGSILNNNKEVQVKRVSIAGTLLR